LDRHYLALVQETTEGLRVTPLADVYPHASNVQLLPIAAGWAAILYENVHGHGAEVELFIIRQTPGGTWHVAHREPFVLDSGDGEEQLTVDGQVSLSVIDVHGDTTPELVLTFVDRDGARPSSTQVWAFGVKGVQRLGSMSTQRAATARRLAQQATVPSRQWAEAVLRLEPKSLEARLQLLAVTPPSSSADPHWWGFYTPGSNNDIALHAGYYARNARPNKRDRLLGIPLVAAWLSRWELSLEELALDTNPLLPICLSGSARYLEGASESMAFSYYYFDGQTPSK
jgi:hypothetical protein